MKTNFPFTAIHQLLLVFFSGSGVSIFRTYFFIFHMQGVQKIKILQFFFSFLTKLVWMPQNGYIESAEEEANKRTVLNRRTYSKPSGRRTGQNIRTQRRRRQERWRQQRFARPQERKRE